MFCPIVAQPGHLQTSAGYLQITLDLRILTVPRNWDFHFRIGGKLQKTEKKSFPPVSLFTAELGHLQTSAGYLRIRLDLRMPTV